jgi:hypothetical protein
MKNPIEWLAQWDFLYKQNENDTQLLRITMPKVFMRFGMYLNAYFSVV